MRHSLFCTIVLAAVLPSVSTLSTSAQSAPAVTIAMHPCGNIGVVIPVMLDRSGPYDFLLDTGTTTTLIDTTLFAQLGLQAHGTIELKSPGTPSTEAQSSQMNVAIGAAAVNDLEVLGLPKLPFGPECKMVRGILGENFLKHFDLLIDNQHRQVTLDAGTGLAESLQGEHLPVAAESVNNQIGYRPIVTVTLEEFDRHPVKVLLDSGAQVMVMFRQRVSQLTPDHGIRTVNGTVACAQSRDWLVWGKATSAVISALTCERSEASTPDHVGNLPTSIFHQIFISHPGSYVIVNPVKRPAAEEEIAAVKPLS